MASASSGDSVFFLPMLLPTPLRDRLPELIISELPPRLVNCSSIIFFAPWVSDTIVITAATPMMIPSVVSIERTLFLRKALYETLNATNGFMKLFLTPQFFFHDLTISKHNSPLEVGCEAWRWGYQPGRIPRSRRPLKNFH